MRSGHLIVRPHRPVRTLMLVLLGVVLLGATGYVAYEQGRNTMREQYLSASAERERLEALKRSLRDANLSLRERTTALERTSQIEREANTKVHAHLKKLQQEVLDLKEELAFYRSIVSSEQARDLDIQSFEVRRDGRGEYLYQLVLTGTMKNDRVISGTIKLWVFGERQGHPVKFSVEELSDAEGISFRLRHFQKVEGRLKLPRGFTPRRVSVQVTASGSKPATLEQSFEWPATVG
ncbi:MAG: hypothetical protein GWN84_10365 [Gammaproteobacteria bacterium]|nr:hypothetical protein [Gammaproteobacteria bacterium]NIR83268.1 hypothetical protein [Gammaproteobacteria bacterium]NIR91068.1 hypothetical protein [Gammaproteobacteria bacterium]NIU04435.1 hypothetical protein [Gammaproteobacteria bacterium]NIW87071.1 hypothetical protein [Gammaproteobacteria bacterium]